MIFCETEGDRTKLGKKIKGDRQSPFWKKAIRGQATDLGANKKRCKNNSFRTGVEKRGDGNGRT